MLRPLTPAALSAVLRFALVTVLSCAVWPGAANAQTAAKATQSAAPSRLTLRLSPAPKCSPMEPPFSVSRCRTQQRWSCTLKV